MIKDIREAEHGRYHIKVGRIGDQYRAVATHGDRFVARVDHKEYEGALEAIRLELDAVNSRRLGERVDGIPSAAEFAAALERLGRKVGKHHWLMLRAHYHARDRALTAAQLAEAAGYEDYSVANEKYGKLARALAEELDYTPQARDDGTPMWTTTIATGERDAEDGPAFRWRLRDEVAAALEALNAV